MRSTAIRLCLLELMRKGRGMETTEELPLQKGSRFKSTLDGVPVILEIDEVVMVDESKGEAVLRTHVVGTYETEVEEGTS